MEPASHIDQSSGPETFQSVVQPDVAPKPIPVPPQKRPRTAHQKATDAAKIGNRKRSQAWDHFTIIPVLVLYDKLVEEVVENDQGKRLKNKKRKKSGKYEAELVAVSKISGVEYGLDSEGLENEEYKPRRKKGLKKKEAGAGQQKAKLKKSSKMKNQIQSLKEEGKVIEKKESTDDDVYQISSGDEDCSKGMKKWIMEYHQRRPGLNELQERIDYFIAAHEERVEQERKEKEAKAAEDGWTVVVHHKGRKKTTEVETGVTVGSVTLAAAQDHKLSKKKKNKEMSDFYRFQRREARKNEIMMLQSKFEQDKKRIQQMRAARKFRPY